MLTVVNICELLERVLFGVPETPAQHRVRYFLFAILLGLGIAHWVCFFNSGNLAWVAYDWVKEEAYLITLRDALVNGRLPWLWSEPYYHGTDKFLANPEVSLLPTVFLLRWMPNGAFTIFHVLLFYVVGFCGIINLSRQLKLCFCSFAILWLLFNFNGYLTAHLAVGHFQWTGYYLLPHFFVFLLDLATDSKRHPNRTTVSVLHMGLLLGTLYMNGSFHIAVWCSIFMALSLLWCWPMFLNVASALFIGGLIGFGRLLPASLWFPKKDGFVSGYPGASILIESLTSVRVHDYGNFGGTFGSLGWWEYDIYIGFTSSIILMIGFVIALKHVMRYPQKPLSVAAGFMLLFSLGDVYAFIANSHLPFASIERVSSRFIIMPFLFFLISAVQGIDQLLRTCSASGRLTVFLGVVFSSFELKLHTASWNISRLERAFQETVKPELLIVSNADSRYVASVYVGWIVSLVSIGAVSAFLFTHQRGTK